MGVFGKYPKASPLVSLTMNSRLLSFILNLAYPPVSFVPNGDEEVFRVYIYTDEGSPRLRSSGFTQGNSSNKQLLNIKSVISSSDIFILIIIIEKCIYHFETTLSLQQFATLPYDDRHEIRIWPIPRIMREAAWNHLIEYSENIGMSVLFKLFWGKIPALDMLINCRFIKSCVFGGLKRIAPIEHLIKDNS